MALQTVYFKEHEGIVHNSVGQLSSVPQAPWWSALGSQPVYGEPWGQLKSLSMENSGGGYHPNSTKQAGQRTEQGLDKGNATQFTIFQKGDYKNLGDGQKPQGAIGSTLSDYRTRFELGFSQPVICTKYPYLDQCYGVFSTYGPQISGRIMLPLNLTTDDGPIYVNAKQYHGIIRRRQSRAKAVLQNKMTRTRKPYMHYSRHLHAMRRPRGCGGRFLNTKNLINEKGGAGAKKTRNGKMSHSSGSQNSEVLQSESGTLNSSKEAHGIGSNLSGSEVTSVFSSGDVDCFQFNHLGSSVRSLSGSGIIDASRGIVMPSKWVAAADDCCNLEI